MRLIVIVYLLSLCGFFGFVTAGEIFDVPYNAFKRIIRMSKEQLNKYIFPQDDLNMFQMIRKVGYPVEAHVIQTEDGYLLTLYRIPNENGLSVLLQHGLLSSFTDFLISGKDKGLAFILANHGYDVWMGNFRGNTYSRAHVSLSPSDPKFWDFSFHEMGVYDLPAMISFITNKTSQPLHTYIGHSMGTTASYVMAAERPEISRMIRMIISLAPTVFLKHIKSPIQYLTPFAENIKEVLHLLGKDEFLPHSSVTQFMSKLVCNMVSIQEKICTNMLFLLCGFDKEQFNITLIPMILSHVPAGTSTKTIIHFAQEHNSGKFCQYDYGRAKNLQIYNSSEPPDYNLVNITIPIALFYSENDWLSSITDVKKLMSLLPNITDTYKVPFPTFNHLDFLYAIDAPRLVYNKLLEVMKMKSTPN